MYAQAVGPAVRDAQFTPQDLRRISTGYLYPFEERRMLSPPEERPSGSGG